MKNNTSPVCSYNEWDPLEEVIVGRLENAMFPSWHTITLATLPPDADELRENVLMMEGDAWPYPPEQIAAAQADLEEFIHILKAEGVRVRRPDVYDFSRPFQTPDWEVKGGFCSANPRDVFLVVGNDIIEASMADRCRYFEMHAYRSLLKEYFSQGARWSAVPRPTLADQLYDTGADSGSYDDEVNYVTTEFEPVFDAADFTRCGRDIFVQRSHVTNYGGIEWMRRHLGDTFKVHEIKSRCRQAMRELGLKPIPCPFSNYYPFGGSFHCATLDVRRRGELNSYF